MNGLKPIAVPEPVRREGELREKKGECKLLLCRL